MTKWTIQITTSSDLIQEVMKVLNFINKLGLKYTIASRSIEDNGAKPR